MGRPKAKYADYAPGVGQSLGRKGRCNVDRRKSFESIFGADLTELEIEFGKAMTDSSGTTGNRIAEMSSMWRSLLVIERWNDMALSQAQQNAIKAHILATPELAALANIGDDVAIANWYKEVASPNYFVWRSSVSRSEVYHSITAEGTVFDWQTFKAQGVNEQNAWVQMFMGDNAPFNKLSFRNGVFAIFSGSTAQNNQRAHIFNCGRRLANQLEKLLSAVPANAGGITVSVSNGNTLASTLGSAANPAVMGYEGTVTPEEIGGLR